MMLSAERTWDRRVEKWHSHVTSAEAFPKVLDRLIQQQHELTAAH